MYTLPANTSWGAMVPISSTPGVLRPANDGLIGGRVPLASESDMGWDPPSSDFGIVESLEARQASNHRFSAQG